MMTGFTSEYQRRKGSALRKGGANETQLLAMASWVRW